MQRTQSLEKVRQFFAAEM